MSGEKDLSILLQNMEPILNAEEYVFCTVEKLNDVPDMEKILFFFREAEAVTIVLEKKSQVNGLWNIVIFLPGSLLIFTLLWKRWD